MLRNYIKVTLRNIRKYKGFSFINIVGLAAGMACCMVIFLYVASEVSYDQYHRDSERIYRVAEHRKVRTGEFDNAQTCPALTSAILKDFPQVEYAIRVDQLQDALIKHENESFYEKRVFYVDPEIFNVFTMQFLEGNPDEALKRPLTMVITKRIAEKYFGSESALGKTMQVSDQRLCAKDDPNDGYRGYKITGVVENPSSNTHYKYDILLSLSIMAGHPRYEIWDVNSVYSYVKLKPHVDAVEFEEQIKRLAHKYVGDDLESWGQDRDYFLQPLTDIHFQSDLAGFGLFEGRGEMEPPGNYLYIYIYSIIGLMVLMIGCMNFINLSNARSVYRTTEVGLRKVVGAGRIQLILQFVGESLIIAIMAVILAFALVDMLLPLFNEMAGTNLRYEGLFNPYVLAAVGGLALFVGIVAGGYPAFLLTSYKPIDIMSNSSSTGTKRSSALKTLVLGQFIISICLAIGTIIVYQQLSYMKGTTVGFEKEHKYIVPLKSIPDVFKNRQAIKTEFSNHHSVLNASVSSTVPGRFVMNNSVTLMGEPAEKSRPLKFMSCDYDYIPMYEIEILAGRSFSEDFNDRNNGFMINEAALKIFGWSSPSEAIGQKIRESFSAHEKEIVGVTDDFHYQGMQNSIDPLLIEYSYVPFLYKYLTLTVGGENLDATMKFVKSKWAEMYPNIPFDGFFLDVDFDLQYNTETQIGRLLSVIAIMGLTIACMGLLGLAAFMARRRTKEIGIRKVLGASVLGIVGLLSRQFVILILMAGVIACPLAYYVMNKWLQDFAYRINPGWTIFALAMGVALMLSVITVSFQAIKAARANPVESLRRE